MLYLSVFGPLLALFLDHIHIACEFTVLPDGKVEGRDLFSVKRAKILNDLPVGSIIYIHISNKEHTGHIIFFTKLPCPLRTGFNAILSGNYNDG